MKSFRKELTFNTPHRRDYVNITQEVEQAVRDSGVREGLCLVNAMHITAGVALLSCFQKMGGSKGLSRFLLRQRRSYP